MRIGTNHGSLSDRIMNRFGDTPLGMVESALEFAANRPQERLSHFKFSMKSSNPKVMIECYRLLAARLEQEGPDWNYPIHLGVTEAGEGEDGRIKSAIGIGSLLCDGLGRYHPGVTDGRLASRNRGMPRLLAQIPRLANLKSGFDIEPSFDPFAYSRRQTPEIELGDGVKCGGEETVRVSYASVLGKSGPENHRQKRMSKPEAVYERSEYFLKLTRPRISDQLRHAIGDRQRRVDLPAITAFRLLAAKLKRLGRNNPILLKDVLV